MGQKTNPNILRIENTNEWTSKYFEKKSTEHSVLTFKNLEIRQYIKQFFKNYGLNTQNIKLFYNDNSLNIYVSYFVSFKSTLFIKTINKIQNLKLKKNKSTKNFFFKKNMRKMKPCLIKHIAYQNYNYKNIIKKFAIRNTFKKIKPAIKHNQKLLRIRRIPLMKYYKKYLDMLKYKTVKNLKTNLFIEKFFETISMFLNIKLNICLTLKQLNKNTKPNITKKVFKFFKKSLTQLRKYKYNKFFKEGLNVSYVVVKNRDSSFLLGKYIAKEIENLKRHNFFIKYLKIVLSILINAKFSKLKGIKIKLKGRFNGTPRAKHKTILIGKEIPLLSINTKVEYSETIANTSNGTFGIKIWTF